MLAFVRLLTHRDVIVSMIPIKRAALGLPNKEEQTNTYRI